MLKVRLTKQQPGLWSRYGTLEPWRQTEERWEVTLAQRTELTHNTHQLDFQYIQNVYNHIPVGHHVFLRATVNGNVIISSCNSPSFIANLYATLTVFTLCLPIASAYCYKFRGCLSPLHFLGPYDLPMIQKLVEYIWLGCANIRFGYFQCCVVRCLSWQMKALVSIWSNFDVKYWIALIRN